MTKVNHRRRKQDVMHTSTNLIIIMICSGSSQLDSHLYPSLTRPQHNIRKMRFLCRFKLLVPGITQKGIKNTKDHTKSINFGILRIIFHTLYNLFVAQLYKQWPYLAKLEECNQQGVLWCYYVLTVAIWIMSLLSQEAWNWGLPFSRTGPMKPWLTKHYLQMLKRKKKNSKLKGFCTLC